MASQKYFQELRNICDDKNCLLIFDEVQTGVARTGKWFGYQLYDVQPDIMTLAKALGGGVPIGAIVAAEKVADVLQPGTHASTYGGNPLVCAASLAVISVIEKENGLEKAAAAEKLLKQNAEMLKQQFNVIKDIRGAGTMLGIELDISGQPIVTSCLENNVLVNCTHDRVIRFLTSVFISENEIETAFNSLQKALSKI